MLGRQLFLPLCQSSRLFFFCNISKPKFFYNIQTGPNYFFQPKAAPDYCFKKSSSPSPPQIKEWLLPKVSGIHFWPCHSGADLCQACYCWVVAVCWNVQKEVFRVTQLNIYSTWQWHLLLSRHEQFENVFCMQLVHRLWLLTFRTCSRAIAATCISSFCKVHRYEVIDALYSMSK